MDDLDFRLIGSAEKHVSFGHVKNVNEEEHSTILKKETKVLSGSRNSNGERKSQKRDRELPKLLRQDHKFICSQTKLEPTTQVWRSQLTPRSK